MIWYTHTLSKCQDQDNQHITNSQSFFPFFFSHVSDCPSLLETFSVLALKSPEFWETLDFRHTRVVGQPKYKLWEGN